MPIGDQTVGQTRISAEELKSRYADLIKEALLKAKPDLDVVRADEVASPGGITTDIYTRLMHSDYVVTDITYPNANVFYELGIRHACRPGTILLRDKSGPPTPFDVSALRHISYENSPSGLKALSVELRKRFDWFELHHAEPDNDFLSLAKLTEYAFQDYGRRKKENADEAMQDAFLEVLKTPQLLTAVMEAQAAGRQLSPAELLRMFADHPAAMQKMFLALLKSGALKLN